MPCTARASVGGVCYHVGNRGNGRRQVFHYVISLEFTLNCIAFGTYPFNEMSY